MQQGKTESNQESRFRINNIGHAEEVLANYQRLLPV